MQALIICVFSSTCYHEILSTRNSYGLLGFQLLHTIIQDPLTPSDNSKAQDKVLMLPFLQSCVQMLKTKQHLRVLFFLPEIYSRIPFLILVEDKRNEKINSNWKHEKKIIKC